MKTSNSGLSLIKFFEGFRSKPYMCPAGIPTIGYGATYYPGGRKVTLSDAPINEEEATALLVNMLGPFEARINKAVKVAINQNEFDALASFSYNLGAASLEGSTLLRKLNAGDRAGAADEFLRWNQAGGKVLDGLTKRRRAERALFLGVINADA